MLAVKNAPEIRVGLFRAIGGGELKGWWSDLPPAPEPAPAAEKSAPPADAEAAPPADATCGDVCEASDPPAGDPELDALLSSLFTPDPPAEDAGAGGEELDPGLAKLLAELG